MAVFGGDGLGMKLNPVNWQFLVLQAHDCAIVKFGGDVQGSGQGGTVNHKRMISGRFERAGQPGKQTCAAVLHLPHFAVNDLVTAHNLAAEGLADGLMTQTDPHQRGTGFGGGFCQCKTNAGLVGVARTRRQQYARGIQRHRLLNVQRIVALNHHIGTKFTQVVDKIVGKAVIVIDKQEHRRNFAKLGLEAGACMAV